MSQQKQGSVVPGPGFDPDDFDFQAAPAGFCEEPLHGKVGVVELNRPSLERALSTPNGPKLVYACKATILNRPELPQPEVGRFHGTRIPVWFNKPARGPDPRKLQVGNDYKIFQVMQMLAGPGGHLRGGLRALENARFWVEFETKKTDRHKDTKAPGFWHTGIKRFLAAYHPDRPCPVPLEEDRT